jgi:hypothetical protein
MEYLPKNVLIAILTSPKADIFALGKFTCSCSYAHKTIQENSGYILKTIIEKRFPHFRCDDIDDEIQNIINIPLLINVLDGFHHVATLDKGQRYQKYLINAWNGKVFHDAAENTHADNVEYKTLAILIRILNYVKEHLAVENQVHHKVNLVPWALYMLLEYVSIRVSDENKNTVFWEEDMRDMVKHQLRHFRSDLRSIHDCSTDIKIRLGRLFRFLFKVYGMV